MRAAISTNRPFHFVMLANALRAHATEIEIFSSAPRKFFKGLDTMVKTRIVPAPLTILEHLMFPRMAESFLLMELPVYDLAVLTVIGAPDIAVGQCSTCLFTGRAVKKRGGKFVLDRACPHRDYQRDRLQREADKLGVQLTKQPTWFRDRQLEEYEMADAILVPSAYTSESFPPGLQHKLVKAPLLGRTKIGERTSVLRNKVFTVGVVGGSPIRKGYLYLLEAWKRLSLPNARLLIRSKGFADLPVLDEMARSMPNVELVGYFPDISDFYNLCDIFVLPSVDDGFGMALFEAMGNSVPCIATTSCGASELLTSGVDSIVVEPACEDELAKAILHLYSSEETRFEMGRAGARTVQRVAASRLYEKAIDSLFSKLFPSAVEAQR